METCPEWPEGNITCIASDEGWLFLAMVIDLFTRRNNVYGETLFSSLKVELLHVQRFETWCQADDETIAWRPL
jgi:hypothetical protein